MVKDKLVSTYDVTDVDWSIDVSKGDFSNNDDFFAVQSGIFEAQDVDGDVTWTSETFDITNYNSLEFSFDALANGDFESSGDIFKIECYIDDAAQILFEGVVDEGIDGDPMFFGDTELTGIFKVFY
ncbi:MAG: hypothetical protein U5L09_09190 [Bacteroidales bacterium]|nr:hypothetical protein [Bacteroidales bacterium]